METEPVREVLADLYTLLEAMETQNAAILNLLREQGVASEEKLRPHLEQAGRASDVKWRAARARMEHLFAPAPKKATEAVHAPQKSETPQPTTSQPQDSKEGAPGSKPVEQPKQSDQRKNADQAKHSDQWKPADQAKQAGQSKPTAEPESPNEDQRCTQAAGEGASNQSER